VASTLSIDPNTIYDEGAVCLALDLPLSALDRARREGCLRFARKGRRVFILGQWLLDWFEAGTDDRGAKSCRA
jgi:hypothetical protein